MSLIMMNRFHFRLTALLPVPLVLAGLCIGCGNPENRDRDFHTSGNREADQRAEQRVAKTQQIRGEGIGDDKSKKDVKAPLYDRLGGEEGVALIVEDWINRTIADPRVNFVRKGVTDAGRFSLSEGNSVEWKPVPENGTRLKKHIAQFITLSTGGPSVYDGKQMKAVHANMKISNDEFDASVGDLKASLDNLKIPTEEQKELLSIIESTRLQVVTKR